MPRLLRRDLKDVVVRTVQEEGWAGLKNGELLSRAQATFDVLVTADQRLRHQQNVPSFDIAVVVIDSRSTRLIDLRPLIDRLNIAIAAAERGTVVIVSAI